MTVPTPFAMHVVIPAHNEAGLDRTVPDVGP